MESPTHGDSNHARKALKMRESFIVGRQYDKIPITSFGSRDLKGFNIPHNDALVIQAKVNNYEVRRVFVNLESFVNVLFQEDLDKMHLMGISSSHLKQLSSGSPITRYTLEEKLCCLCLLEREISRRP